MVSIKLLSDTIRKRRDFFKRIGKTIVSSKTKAISVRNRRERAIMLTEKRGGGRGKERAIKAERCWTSDSNILSQLASVPACRLL